MTKTRTAIPSVYNALGCLLDYKGDRPQALKVLQEGHEKYTDDRSIIHNLAYVLLMNHDIAGGRRILEQYHDLLEEYAREEPTYQPVLTATWGLVHLLEGKLDVGAELYREAARVAARLGTKRLVGAVRQKMHIELATIFLQHSEYESAKREIEAGLAIKRGREPYHRELKQLQLSLSQLQ